MINQSLSSVLMKKNRNYCKINAALSPNSLPHNIEVKFGKSSATTSSTTTTISGPEVNGNVIRDTQTGRTKFDSKCLPSLSDKFFAVFNKIVVIFNFVAVTVVAMPTFIVSVAYDFLVSKSSFLNRKDYSEKSRAKSSISYRLHMYLWHRMALKFMTTKLGIFFGTIFIITNVIASVEGIKINSVVVPPHQKSGNPVQLECHYDLEGEDLYSVKWYRGSNEFFRFVPGEKNPMNVFELPGVVVDTALSDSRKVTLRTVTRESSGKYKCEVSADYPSFHTISKSSEMLVVDFSNSVPNITGGRSRYHVGDEVHVNCTSAKSRPAASLMWYINNDQARSDELVEYAPVQDEDGLETSRLGLRFIVGAKDFPNGVLKIRCTATVAAVYWNSAEEAVEGQLPQTSPALESKGVYTGGSSSTGFSSMNSLEMLTLPVLQFILKLLTFCR